MGKNHKNLERFKKKLRFYEYADSTIDNYSYYIRLFLDYTNKPLSHVFKKDAYLFLDECSDEHWITKNQIISSLKLFFKYVLESELSELKTERPRKTKKLPRVIDWNELETKLERIKNIKHKAILEIACRCALRVSEVCNIRLTDVDTERMNILIRNSKGNKDRYVPVSEKLMALLFAYVEEYDPREFLFEGQRGKYSVSSCQKLFKKHIDKTKSFHTLRHSGATQMLNNGTNLRTIQNILGHASSQTSEIYTHVSSSVLQQAAL